MTKRCALLFVFLLSVFQVALCFAAEIPSSPVRAGLVLWLDASHTASVEQNAGGNVVAWQDRATGKKGTIRGNVSIIPEGINGLNVLRFGEKDQPSGCDFPTWHETEAPISLFIVWRRTEEQASEKQWQRLVACENPERTKGFCLTGAMRGSAAAMEPVLYTVNHVSAAPLPFTVGLANPPSIGNPLRGDIAEILVYNRRFDDAEEFHEVEDYLLKKWGCQPDLNSQGWLRPSNELPLVPRDQPHVPLHDQANEGAWSVYEPWTDEFEDRSLNESRWYDYNPNWHGRAPARYLPRNVNVEDGVMGITMSRDASTEPLLLYGEGSKPYHTYTAASVVSKAARTYGSFEIRCRAMPSYATSAWWFFGDATNATGEVFSNEIDVFEIGATVPGEEARCGGNLHVTKAPGLKRKVANPAGWIAPFRFGDDWHTFGLDWGPEYIRWYLDGTLYRSSRNTHWHTPLRMLFDTEIWSWWPTPRPEDFPSTFHVDYVRSWTRADWPTPEGVSIRPVSKSITRLLKEK